MIFVAADPIPTPAVHPAPGNGRAELLVVGSVSHDCLTLPTGRQAWTLGGAGLYAALGAAATATMPVRMVGVVGADHAHDAAALLASRTVQHTLSTADAGLRFDITYDHQWRARYLVDGADAEAAIGPALLESVGLSPSAAHLCPTGPPQVQLGIAAALRAAHGDKLVLSATAFRNRIIEQHETVLSLCATVDVLVCDTVELTLLTRSANLQQALTRVARMAGPSAVCVTDAERGSYLITAGTIDRISAYPTTTVDPTGAGETFAGAMAAARLAGHDLVSACVIASAAASITVEGAGPTTIAAADPAEVARRAAVLTGAVPAPVHGGV